MCTSEQIQERLAQKIGSIGLLSESLVSEDYDKDVLTSGWIDSFGFVEFITFVETEFSISIDDELQFDERIRTIKGMTEIIMEIKS